MGIAQCHVSFQGCFMVYKLGHIQSPNFKVGNQKLLYNYKPSPQFPTTQGIKILGCLKIPPEKTTKESLFKSMGSCHHPPATSPGKMEAISFVKKKHSTEKVVPGLQF